MRFQLSNHATSKQAPEKSFKAHAHLVEYGGQHTWHELVKILSFFPILSTFSLSFLSVILHVEKLIHSSISVVHGS